MTKLCSGTERYLPCLAPSALGHKAKVKFPLLVLATKQDFPQQTALNLGGFLVPLKIAAPPPRQDIEISHPRLSQTQFPPLQMETSDLKQAGPGSKEESARSCDRPAEEGCLCMLCPSMWSSPSPPTVIHLT